MSCVRIDFDCGHWMEFPYPCHLPDERDKCLWCNGDISDEEWEELFELKHVGPIFKKITEFRARPNENGITR